MLRPTVRGRIGSRGLDGEGGLERDVARRPSYREICSPAVAQFAQLTRQRVRQIAGDVTGAQLPAQCGDDHPR